MTESEPEAVFCQQCHTAIRLERTERYQNLQLSCSCDGCEINIKVAEALPEGWK
jgi:hypothetical protein